MCQTQPRSPCKSSCLALLGWLFFVWVGRCVAADGWQSTVVTTDAKDEPAYDNSQRIALDSLGRPYVLYVTQNRNSDTLHVAHHNQIPWRHEAVYTMQHSGRNISGVDGYAIALDGRNQPHIYFYSRDYQTSRSVFAEHWAYLASGRWRVELIRSTVNKLAGAGLHDPHLAIDRRGNMHVTAYAHAGFGTYHRARHRYYNGSDFRIDPFPRAPGKSDSGPSNLVIDDRDVIHFVYDSKTALRRGTNADVDYPNSSLIYITRKGRNWSRPQVIRRHVGPMPSDNDYYIRSVALTLDRTRSPHIVYTVRRRGVGAPTDIDYIRRTNSQWRHQHVKTIPGTAGKTFNTAVFNPGLDPAGNLHFAFDTAEGATYARWTGRQWEMDQFDGDLQGFAWHPRTGPHLLTSSKTTLTHHEPGH